MIQSFTDKPAQALWLGQEPPELPSTILKPALRKLTQLEAASTIEELRIPPGNQLEALKDRKGQYTIRINDNFRVCFRWDGKNANDVEIAVYH